MDVILCYRMSTNRVLYTSTHHIWFSGFAEYWRTARQLRAHNDDDDDDTMPRSFFILQLLLCASLARAHGGHEAHGENGEAAWQYAQRHVSALPVFPPGLC